MKKRLIDWNKYWMLLYKLPTPIRLLIEWPITILIFCTFPLCWIVSFLYFLPSDISFWYVMRKRSKCKEMK